MSLRLGEISIAGLQDSSNLANKSLTNLTDDGKNIATWSSNVTNCLTHIPQDIKLELNNGVLTLKAGSKVYVPDGFEQDGTTPKFDEIIISTDMQNEAIPQTSTCFIRYNITTGHLFCDWDISTFASGSEIPSGYNGWFYNTTINTIRHYANGSIDAPEQCSLPIGIVTNTNTSVTSIDQVFNGFGYIGSTVFALPGVKGLIPNGRNDDGTLKNTKFVNNSVKIREIPNGSFQFIFDGQTINYAYWYDNIYDENKNIIDYMGNGVIFAQGSVSNSSFTLFSPKTAFHALDWNNKNTIAGWSMPSNEYIDLTLNASGSTYTAPANGYFLLNKNAPSQGQYIYLINHSTELGSVNISNGGNVRTYLPVKKGDIIEIVYDASGTTTFFRFVYAEGEI